MRGFGTGAVVPPSRLRLSGDGAKPQAAGRQGCGRACLAVAALLLVLGEARGDGGTVRLSERRGGYQVTVFTAPTPFRAGPVDVSVLVQDAATGEPLPDTRVIVQVSPPGRPDLIERHAATGEAATNKLYHAAKFDLSAPGRWRVEVHLDGVHGPARVAFEAEAADALPRWMDLWLWIALPVGPIVLFGIHLALTGRKSRREAVNASHESTVP